MNNILTNLVKNINNKIELLKQERIEVNILLNNNPILRDKVGEYLKDISDKFNELLKYIDLKIELCELKKKRYEEELYMENYNLWLNYVDDKKQYINSIIDEVENLDLLSITDLDELTETESVTNVDFYNKKTV